MANDTMKLYKDIAEKSVASIKNVSELNLRTFEALAAKQVEVVQNAEIAKNYQRFFLTLRMSMRYFLHSLTLLMRTLKSFLIV